MTSPIIVALDLEHDLALDLAKSLDPNNCRLKWQPIIHISGPK